VTVVTETRLLEVKIDSLDRRLATLRLPRPEVVAALRRSIEREGLLVPLVVNRVLDGALVVLDGFKRLEVLRELGHEMVSVRVVHLEDPAARAALLAYNVGHRGVCELEEAWVVHSLVRSCKRTQKQVAELLGRHKSWVCRRLQLAERLDPTVQEDMRLGLCHATVARELARLPRGNQPRVAQVVRDHGLSSRQAAGLVDVFLSSDDREALDAVLEDPLRYIDSGARARDVTTTRDPRLTDRGEAIRARLSSLERASLSASAVLRQHPASRLPNADLLVLGELASTVHQRGVETLGKLADLITAAGPSDG